MKREEAVGEVLDDFCDAASWLPVASGEAQLELASEEGAHGRALRMDFDFRGGGGFVVARKEIARALPESCAFSFRVRGVAPRNKLEFKLADPSGRNVWRWQEEGFEFRRAGCWIRLRNREIEFAWGPAGGGSLRKLGAVEFVISAGPGGKGTVWIEDFRFEDRTCRKTPLVTVSGAAKGCDPQAVLKRRGQGAWRAAARDAAPWLQVDFHQAREAGGLTIDWQPEPASRAFAVQASDDGIRWRTVRRVRAAGGMRSFLPLPGFESRFLRLAFATPGVGVRRIEVQPFDFSRSEVEFFHAVAAASPRGDYPRWLGREQSYWTCAGVADGYTCALINEEGMVEPDKGSFSIEPFLWVDGRLFRWSDVRRKVSLEHEELPIPSAHWSLPGMTLQTTAFGSGAREESVLWVRYLLSNNSGAARRARLFLALRPFQVNPPWQAWQGLGGISPIRELAWRGGAAWVNGDKAVVPLQRPSGFGAAAFEHGAIAGYLAAGKLPDQLRLRDSSGFASGALRFDLTLPAGQSREVFVAVPFEPAGRLTPSRLRDLAAVDGPAQFREAVREMERRLGAVKFRMPPGPARAAARTFKTAAGQILVNRDGPALQPGPRRYTRSWIRDGAVMGAALLRIGDNAALADFVRWFAPWQRGDGFVPCCVDRTGPDWLVEHDSHGQFIYAIREWFRFAGDLSLLREMWPRVRKAADFIGRLRRQRLTAEFGRPGKRSCRGLLPESASHEGYLAHPVHSYWDDFWALRGLVDAAAVAQLLGRAGEARRFAALARAMRRSVRDSLQGVIDAKRLPYVPGSVEWADFDPTATANAVAMLQADADLPPRQLGQMFDRFVRDFRRKRSGAMEWNNYTAYEIRIVGALARLGKREEAAELLEFFLSDRRPVRWNQWPEISWRDPRSPGHLGDVPHTWIAAEYMLAFASLFAYERETGDSLVLAAGLPLGWVEAPGGVAVAGLPTWHGPLDLSLRRAAAGHLEARIGGALVCPGGGFVLRPPWPSRFRRATVNGRAARVEAGREVVVRELPAEVVLA